MGGLTSLVNCDVLELTHPRDRPCKFIWDKPHDARSTVVADGTTVAECFPTGRRSFVLGYRRIKEFTAVLATDPDRPIVAVDKGEVKIGGRWDVSYDERMISVRTGWYRSTWRMTIGGPGIDVRADSSPDEGPVRDYVVSIDGRSTGAVIESKLGDLATWRLTGHRHLDPEPARALVAAFVTAMPMPSLGGRQRIHQMRRATRL